MAAPHQELPTALHVTGSVNKVRFRADSGFTVALARLKNDDGEDPDAVMVGVMPPLEAGDSLQRRREHGGTPRVRLPVPRAEHGF